ncbi:MAG: hypothetical protein O2960_09235 [Verrucomicrobia bacterium]|nr:hypothetical protein [Verrucomicrobiota bacterium]
MNSRNKSPNNSFNSFVETPSISASATETEIWNRAIRTEVGDLSPTAARELLRLHLANDDAERVRELSSKANTGRLNADEAPELDYFLNVGRALEFLKAKSRLSLGETATPA